MSESLVDIDRSHPHFTVLLLNRPSKRNALNIELMDQLIHAIEETQKLPNQRAIILKGAGAVFCAGLDLAEANDPMLEEASSKAIGRLFKTIDESPLVTIAAVHGAALAGGIGILCTCDLVVAESSTIFGLPETRRGLVAAQVMPYALRMIAKRFLAEMLLTGESVDVERAHEIGLVNKIVSTYSSLPEAIKFVDSILKGAPQATSMTKKLLRKPLPLLQEEYLEVHRAARQGDEAKEGLKAYAEKRPPHWA
jgi:methylglutaconyl-CoA hydratase